MNGEKLDKWALGFMASSAAIFLALALFFGAAGAMIWAVKWVLTLLGVVL